MYKLQDIEENLQSISRHYGLDKQLDITIEECSELIQAISKYKRYKNTPQEASRTDNLKEELADVYIMVRQIIDLLESEDEVNEVIQKKIDRQLHRIENEK